MLPLFVCLCLPCLFWNMALWNLFGCLDGNGCTDFPSQQKSFVKLADISMLCNNMTRWPLTHLCSPKQLCPKNLCAKCCLCRFAFVCLAFFGTWHCAISLEVLMAMVAQTSQVSKGASLSLLISPCCATTWHVDPWHICVALNSCVPRIFVPQMLPLFALSFLEHGIVKSLWMSWLQWLHRLPKSAKEHLHAVQQHDTLTPDTSV